MALRAEFRTHLTLHCGFYWFDIATRFFVKWASPVAVSNIPNIETAPGITVSGSPPRIGEQAPNAKPAPS